MLMTWSIGNAEVKDSSGMFCSARLNGYFGFCATGVSLNDLNSFAVNYGFKRIGPILVGPMYGVSFDFGRIGFGFESYKTTNFLSSDDPNEISFLTNNIFFKFNVVSTRFFVVYPQVGVGSTYVRCSLFSSSQNLALQQVISNGGNTTTLLNNSRLINVGLGFIHHPKRARFFMMGYKVGFNYYNTPKQWYAPLGILKSSISDNFSNFYIQGVVGFTIPE
jgi:hypothetical protein